MRATVYKAPAGCGKSHLFAMHIANAKTTGRIEVYTSTHALAQEWLGNIKSYNPNRRVNIIAGRDQLGANQQQLCARHKLAAQVFASGQSVFPRLCHSGGPSPVAQVCPHYDTCAHIKQYQGADVFIYTHAHLHLARGMLDNQMPEIVVIDESFFGTCLATITLNIQLLIHPDVPSDAKALCADIAAALQGGTSLHSRFTAARRHGGDLRRALQALKQHSKSASPGTPESIIVQLIKQRQNFTPTLRLIEHLDQALLAKHQIQSVDFDVASGAITAHHRHQITRFNPKEGDQAPDIFLLDASASPTITEVFFPGAKFLTYALKRKAQVFQCASTRCATSSLVPSLNSAPQNAAIAKTKLADIQTLIDEQSANCQKLLVVGPSKITGNPANGTPALVTIPSHGALAHFNAVRGVDGWKGFDTVLIIGRNEPPVLAVEALARALYFDSPQALNLTGSWHTEVRGYRTQGSAQGVDVIVHRDLQVQAVLEQLRECEALQSLDRLRLIHCTEIKRVILLSNLPLDIDVDRLLTWDEMMKGNRFDQALAASGGVLPMAADWLASHFPAIWFTKGAAKKDVQRTIKRGQFSNNISIRNLSPLVYEYRPTGQRSWSRCLSTLPDAAAVSVVLDGLLATSTIVRGPIP